MNKRFFKVSFIIAKIILAVVLLGWVFSQVHWHDYVIARDNGKAYSVLGRTGQMLRVSQGAMWWRTTPQERPVSDFTPTEAGGQDVIRLGFVSTMERINPWLLTMAMGGFLLSLLIVALRWRFLLGVQDIHIRVWESIRLMFLGQFFNYVVPGTVGGDLVKAYYVSRHTPRKAAVVVSVFLDRMLGLTELTFMGGVMVLVVWWTGLVGGETLRMPAIAIGVIIVIVTVAFVFLFSERLRRALHLQKLYQRLPIAHHIAAMGEAAAVYYRQGGAMVKAVVMTFASHIAWIGAIALVGFSLGLDVPWYSYFLYIPLIYIIGAVPITPGGVGVIENLFVLFFAMVNPSEALALALLARLLPMVCGLPGVWVAVTGPKLPKTDEIQAELGLDDESA